MAFSTAMTMTPTSAKMASPHIGDAHAHPAPDTGALMPRAKTMFSYTIRRHLAGDADGLGDLQGVVVHQHHVRRFNGGIGAHGAHGDADIGAGQHRGIVDAVAHEGQLAVRRCFSSASTCATLSAGSSSLWYLVHAQFSGHVVGHLARLSPVSMTVFSTPACLQGGNGLFGVGLRARRR